MRWFYYFLLILLGDYLEYILYCVTIISNKWWCNLGFFASLKELFNKNIECDADMNNHIVFFLKKKKYLYLNKNIMVREGTTCVVVYKSKVCDVILPGKYKINEQIIPETCSRAKIEKLSKQGKNIKKIRCDLYFLSTKDFKDFDFDSDEPFFLKSRELGRVRGFMKGCCTVRVLDPAVLIKCLIAETGKEKTEDVNNDIGLWIGNKINKKIEKNKIPIENIINNNEYVATIINTELEDAFDNIGIFVKNIKLKAIDFPKKYQKKINDYMVSHKAIIKPSVVYNNSQKVAVQNSNSYVSVNNMKNNQISNINGFVVCRKCGFKNVSSNNICNNCGNRLD